MRRTKISNKTRSSLSQLSILLLVFGLVSAIGCGGSDGPKRYDLSGTVTFDGKPIPAGSIIFQPNASAGNSGPQGAAEIRDGKYDTSANGKGMIGGPHIVRITGFDGIAETEMDIVKPLFAEYQIEVDLPEESGAKDFEVPGDAPKAPESTGAEKL